MPDQNDQTVKRTPEEIAATVEKLKAEARRAASAADHNAAQARTESANAEIAEINRDRKVREENSNLADADLSRIYYFTDGVSAGSAQKCAKQLGVWSRQDPECKIEIVFTSPGGSVIDGMYLFDVIQDLRKAGHHVTTGTYGMAASMAGILLQAGDVRWMSQQSWVLIHKASFGAIGSYDEVEDRVKWIERIQNRIISIFVARSNGKLTSQKIKRNWDRKDWWLDAEEAYELGVVDEVRGGLPEMETPAG